MIAGGILSLVLIASVNIFLRSAAPVFAQLSTCFRGVGALDESEQDTPESNIISPTSDNLT
jgi:hypothetical protein